MSGGTNSELGQDIEDGPDAVSKALEQWRLATLKRKKKHAMLYIYFFGEDPARKATFIKALIENHDEYYNLILDEAAAEREYIRLYEKLLSAKKLYFHT